ncbi:Alpha/beta hydrolase [Burkholderia sp. 8Y]|uniref:serine aminopeptidase domain-containing protein n=1 Tax=Burkholderia sp. 8Y TaxID=2653133 RepID=UPI0012EF81A3|nr:alpha/beta hydrolase [Burkholderia sp. 8Y]VXB01678.1 Alpha/beta hydrolase [Burkholderia sp. 8Y]
MTPIAFKGRFGWLHVGHAERGVVLCNPFGHECAWAHKAMRYLADELSYQGFPVLRFDYLATGDSAGLDDDNDRLDHFVADIGEAIDCLCKETGATKVTLCGLRLGASLAALASHDPRVDSLAMLAPVTSGRRYLRELTALRKAWIEHQPVAVRTLQIGAPFNVLGQSYNEAFRSRLAAFDLARAMNSLPAMLKRVFVADAPPGASQSLCAVLLDRGVDVRTDTFDDYYDFMQDTAWSALPERTLKGTAQWIAEGAAESISESLAPDLVSKATRPRMLNDVVIKTPEAIERPVLFSTAGLFGILCEPRERPRRGPVVLITNTAATAHQGDSRISVRIARELARRGIASMRIDARGIGDSPPLSPDAASDATLSIHAASIIEDVSSAAAWLKRKGYDTVVAFGICSGAYSALRASLAEPAISAVIALNLQRFYIPEQMTLPELRDEMSNTMARLAPAILKPAKWWLVLNGKRELKPIAKAFASHAAARLNAQVIGVSRQAAPDVDARLLEHPHDVIQRLEQKGVDTLLLYGVGDDGLDQLNAHFGRHGKKLSRLARVKAMVCNDIDHSLYDPRALAKVISLSATFIGELHCDGSPFEEAVSNGD